MTTFMLTDGELSALLSAAFQQAQRCDPEHYATEATAWIHAFLTNLALAGPVVHHGDVAQVLARLQTRAPVVREKVLALKAKKHQG
jgi:hypothetical protein